MKSSHRDIESRFWSKVDTSGICWEWTRSRNQGYGQFRIGKRVRKAHQVAWELLIGPIPEGLEPDHLCRNRACVNPDHLEWVTHSENWNRGLGAGPAKQWHRNKNHCKHGHEFTQENTYIRPDSGNRQCITCRDAHVR